MPAVVTDQFRITNAGNFVDSVLNENNSYYVFLGLPNPQGKSGETPQVGFGRTSNWNASTPDPVDNIQYLNHYRDTSLFGKKINSSNIRRVIKKHNWVANKKYDMYRHDYALSDDPNKNNPTPNAGGGLYNTNYYVITSEFKVYICLDNGGFGTGNDAKGNGSKDEPTFTDLEPSAAGTSNDGYIWKYLFTVSPSDVIKFDSIEYIVLPNDWSTTTDSQILAVRESANSDVNENQIKTVYIKNRGNFYGSNKTYACNIIGDGSGARALVTVTDQKITNVVVTSGGSGYTFAQVDLSPLPFNQTSGTRANLIPIIPPSKGHGFDIYTELGADKVLVYTRFDDTTKDFPIDTHFAQVGIIKNPNGQGNTGILTTSQFSSTSSIKFESGINPPGSGFDSIIGEGITQDRIINNINVTARGTVVSYDPETFVLKYIQDRSLNLNPITNDTTDFQEINQKGSVVAFGSTEPISSTSNTINSKKPNSTFSGITTTINNKQINLGVNFTNGLADSEINKKTGEIIYIDNRKEVTRNIRQKEDVKIILEF